MRRKKYKKVSQENEEATQNKTIEQAPYQRDKYLGSSYCKKLGTILEVEQRRT